MWSERRLAMLREMGIRLWPAGAGLMRSSDASANAETDAAAVAVVEEARPTGAASTMPMPAVSRTPRPTPTPTLPASKPGFAPGPAPSTAPALIPVQPEVAVTAHAVSFDTMVRSASVCTACRHAQGRRAVVFGSGSARADWMFVGDAPDEAEEAAGEPFVGKSGELLDNMLLACGLRRNEGGEAGAAIGARTYTGTSGPDAQAFVTHALKCRPRGDGNPAPDDLQRCETWLLQQIALVEPKVVVAMGRYAIQSLLHSTEPLGKLRGRVHRVHGAPEVAVVPTFHPAYLLRNGADKARAWDDLCRAMEVARG